MTKLKKWLSRIKKPSLRDKENEAMLDQQNEATNRKEDPPTPSRSIVSHVSAKSGIELDDFASCCSTPSHVTVASGGHDSTSPSSISHFPDISGEDPAGVNCDVGKVLRSLKTGGRSEVNAALKGFMDFSHEKKRLFIEEGGVQLMLTILRKKRRCQVFAGEALISLFNSGLDWRGAFDAGNGTDLVVQLVERSDLAALGVVPYLLETHEGILAFHAAGGIKALTRALKSGGEKVRMEAIKGLSVMAREGSLFQNEIAASGGLTSLKKLCVSERESGLACMKLIAEVVVGNDHCLRDMALMQWVPVMYMLRSGSLEMREAVARLLSTVSASLECRQAICFVGGIGRMMACLDSGQTEAEMWILCALRNFCTLHADTAMRILDDPSIMARILAEGTPACRLEAMRCLTTFEGGTCMRRISATETTVQSLVEILHMENPECRIAAARLLSSMVSSDGIRAQLVTGGGIPPLVQLLKYLGPLGFSGDCLGGPAVVDVLAKLSEEASVGGIILAQGALVPLAAFLSEASLTNKLPAMECLSNLARTAKFDDTTTSSAILETLTELLKQESVKVVCGAANCLARILDGRPHLQEIALSGGILSDLERMLPCRPHNLAAVTVLAKLSHTEQCKASFKQFNTLVSMLPHAPLEDKNRLAAIVADLITDRASALQLLHNPWHESLLQLLDTASPGAAVRALASIAVHSPSLRTALAGDFYLRKIISRLMGLELSDMADAARYIGVVVHENVAHQNRVAHCAGIHPLVWQLTLPHSRCKAMAAGALAALVEENSSNQRAVAREGAFPCLVLQLDDEDEECRQEAAHALANLTFQNPANQSILAKQEPGGPLLKLLEGSSSTAAKCHAGRIFANLAQSTKPEVVALREPCIGPLVAMLSSDESECQENAAGYLANLACCEAEQRMIKEAGGIPPLVDLVRSGQPTTQKHAARALANISCQDDHVPEIVSQGGIDGLVNLLSSTVAGNRKQAAGALANIACKNAQNSRLIIEAGGIPCLLNLLSSEEDACRIQSIRVIHNVACSPDTKKALVNSGILTFMGVLLKEVHADKKDLKKKLVRALVGLMSGDEETQLSVLNEDVVEPLLAALKQGGGDPQVEIEVRRALLTLACGAEEEGAAQSELQAGRIRCVASILGAAPSLVKESPTEKKEAVFFGDQDTFEGIPRHLLCPITHELLEDPVVAADGHTYERSAITAWFRNKNTSPMTNQKLTNLKICPNRLVASMVQEFKTKLGDIGF
ncbi:hypothetical protein BSKO_07037 [Bryopsis sp. KO-2023]|nr:hypothetical protein BSKO_07037 [Bryopsis sp. KO-2023]